MAPNPATGLSAKDEIEALCARVGGALVAVQIIERQLHRILHLLRPDRPLSIHEIGDYFRTRPMLLTMIKELRQRAVLPDEFPELLDEFRLSRNKLVHAMLDEPGANLGSHNGRMVCYRLAQAVHMQAATLNEIIMGIFGGDTEMIGRDWLERGSAET